MSERFGAPHEPQKKTGEVLGVSSASLEAYAKALTSAEKRKKRSVEFSVGEWQAPHGKIPPTVDLYLVSTKTSDGHHVELRSMHPESLDEEDLSAMLGDALPRAVEASHSPEVQAALENVLRERRRDQVLQEVHSIKDHGIRTICEHLVTETVADGGADIPVHDRGGDMLRAIHRALTDGSHLAMPEMRRAIHRFGLEWMGLSKQEQDHARKSLAHATA